MTLTSLGLLMSAIMKIIGEKEIVEGLSKSGLGNYVRFIGIIELFAVTLFLIPKTFKLGFLLLCAYLGGAISIELVGGQTPAAAIFLAIIWISVYLRNQSMFLHQPVKEENIIT